MDELEIRKLRDGELEAALALWQRSFASALPELRPDQRHGPEKQREFFTKVVAKRCELWLAVHGEQPVGLLAMNGDEIDRLYIDPDWKRQRVGSALMEHAKRLSPSGLRLVTLQRNHPACRFYEAHGFVAGKRGVSPPPENEPDVWYRWSPG